MKFKEGQELSAIHFNNGEAIIIPPDEAGKGKGSIKVSIESCGVWFNVWKDGRLISKWNADQCDGVIYK